MKDVSEDKGNKRIQKQLLKQSSSKLQSSLTMKSGIDGQSDEAIEKR